MKATPWVDHGNAASFFTKPVSYNTSVYIDGGGENGSFKLGYTRTSDGGVMPNSRINKNLLNFGATYNLAPNLTAGGSINYSGSDGLGRYGTRYGGHKNISNVPEMVKTHVGLEEKKKDFFTIRGEKI